MLYVNWFVDQPDWMTTADRDNRWPTYMHEFKSAIHFFVGKVMLLKNDSIRGDNNPSIMRMAWRSEATMTAGAITMPIIVERGSGSESDYEEDDADLDTRMKRPISAAVIDLTTTATSDEDSNDEQSPKDEHSQQEAEQKQSTYVFEILALLIGFV